jgi:hypothetical protein
VDLLLEKNRAGPPATVPLTFDGRWQTFSAQQTVNEKAMIKDRAQRAASQPQESEDLFND